MADNTGFDGDRLQRIIGRTQGQVAEMESARNRIENATDRMVMAVQADSGVVLRRRLGEWQTEYHDIKGRLDTLNMQVLKLLAERRSTDASTTATASA